ncbi:MAG: hypothetical protein HYY48_01085 [Gammaproteobacteria bacterium]|nr:hypothetical protein [Gammaproteobacteria bacterium]
MRAILILGCALLISSAHGQEPFRDDVAAMLYISVPFGANKQTPESHTALGLSVSWSPVKVNRLTGYDAGIDPAKDAAMVDVQFTPKTRFFSKFALGGIDALTYRKVYSADGSSTQWPMGLSTTQVVLGALVAVGVGYFVVDAIKSEDDDLCVTLGDGTIECEQPPGGLI